MEAPQRPRPEIAAALGSLLLSALVFARRPMPNNDGVYYLLAAEAFARDGLSAATSVYPWPLFSIAVATLSTTFGVSMAAAAYGIGALFLAVTSAAFVAVVRALGADARTVWFAVAAALCHPWLNQARVMIVRDGGVWAFGMLALLLLLRSDDGRDRKRLAGWAACGGLSVLFRPDAAALMIGGPIALALGGAMDRARRWVMTLVLCGATLVVLAGALWWLDRHPTTPGGLASLEAFGQSAAALAASFPLPHGREYAPYILAIGLLALPLIKTLVATGPVHLLLGSIGASKGANFTRFQTAALLGTITAALVPLYFQAFRLLFVESRYAVFATLVLSIWAPFGLRWLFAEQASAGRRLCGSVCALGLVLSLLLNLPLRPPPEEHVIAAADWIHANAHAIPLHTNSLQIAYASRETVALGLVYYAQVHGAVDRFLLPENGIWAVRVAAGDVALFTRLDESRKFKPAARLVYPRMETP